MTRALALGVLAFWAACAGAAELPSHAVKPKPGGDKTPRCEINGAPGFAMPGGGCVRIGGYVSVGVSAGKLRP